MYLEEIKKLVVNTEANCMATASNRCWRSLELQMIKLRGLASARYHMPPIRLSESLCEENG